MGSESSENIGRGIFLVFVIATILWVSPTYGASEQSLNSRDILYEASRATETLRKGLLVKVLPDIAVAQARGNDSIAARDKETGSRKPMGSLLDLTS
jgi:hypothetical protein